MGWWLTLNLCNSLTASASGRRRKNKTPELLLVLLHSMAFTAPLLDRSQEGSLYSLFNLSLWTQKATKSTQSPGTQCKLYVILSGTFPWGQLYFFGWFIKPFVLGSEHYANIRFFLSSWKMAVPTCLMAAISLEANWIWIWNTFASPVISLQGHAKINTILFYHLSFLPSQ